jgi:hypothetical protein
LEIIQDEDGDAYRGVYTVKREIDLVKERLKGAEELYFDWCKERRRGHD